MQLKLEHPPEPVKKGGREESKRGEKSKADVKSDDHSLSTRHHDAMDYVALAPEQWQS